MALDTCCFIGRGKTSLRLAGTTDPFLQLGNVETLNLAVNDSEISVPNFTLPGNLKECSLRQIDSVTLSALLRCLKRKNLALATYGKEVAVSASAVSNESQTPTAYDSFLPFIKLPDPTAAYVVTNIAGSTTYVEGTDYTKGNGGIYIPTGSAIPLATAIYIDYTAVAASQIEFFVHTGKEYEVIFDGINQVNSQAFYLHLYRVRFGAAKQLDFISKEFASIDVTAEVLASSTIVGDDDTSAYGYMRI